MKPSPTPVGIHILADLFDCPLERFGNAMQIRQMMTRVLEGTALIPLGASFHEFDGGGVTGVILLSQSHLSVHTWPEFAYVSFDLFSCGDETEARKVFELVREAFSPKRVVTKVVERGLPLRERARTDAGSEGARGEGRGDLPQSP